MTKSPFCYVNNEGSIDQELKEFFVSWGPPLSFETHHYHMVGGVRHKEPNSNLSATSLHPFSKFEAFPKNYPFINTLTIFPIQDKNTMILCDCGSFRSSHNPKGGSYIKLLSLTINNFCTHAIKEIHLLINEYKRCTMYILKIHS